MQNSIALYSGKGIEQIKDAHTARQMQTSKSYKGALASRIRRPYYLISAKKYGSLIEVAEIIAAVNKLHCGVSWNHPFLIEVGLKPDKRRRMAAKQINSNIRV